MRVTRAYIASAGTAAVMLGASLSLFALLSAFIAFGSWPGADTGRSVDQIILSAVQSHHAPAVTVRRDAVLIAERQARKRAEARANERGPAVARIPGIGPGGTAQGVASAPTSSGGPGRTGRGGGGNDPVTKQVDNTTKQVQDTTQQVTQQVQNTTTDVQTQVDEVVGGIGGPGGDTVQQVKDTTGSVIGH